MIPRSSPCKTSTSGAASELRTAREREGAPPSTTSGLLTVAQAADYLGTSRRFVYDLIASGRLSRARPFGGRLLVPRSELDDEIVTSWREAWRR